MIGAVHRRRSSEGGRRTVSRLATVAAAVAAAGLLALLLFGAAPAPRGMLDPAAWEAVPADGVEMRLSAAPGPGGAPALRLDYDFHGHSGWAAARRRIDLELPPHYEIRFQLRGEGPRNNLEVKLVDASGANVWWHVDRNRDWPAAWTPARVKQRQVTFAWGPAGGGEPKRIGALELTVSASSGGRGTLWFAGLEIVPAEPAATVPGRLSASTTSETKDHEAAFAVDGDEDSSWRPLADEASELRVDLGDLVELGGLTLVWERGREPRQFAVDLSRDGATWEASREVTRGGAARSHLRLPEAEARVVRLRLPADAGCAGGCGLAELIVRPLAFGASPNDFFVALAAEEPRGTYPRGFRQAVYWTVTGPAGAPQEALVSEDGAVEVGERGFSLEPALWLEGHLYTWADVRAIQMLQDGELPIPTVTWIVDAARRGRAGAGPAPTSETEEEVPSHSDVGAGPASARASETKQEVPSHSDVGAGPAPARPAETTDMTRATLAVTAVAAGEAESPTLLVRYRLHNDSPERLRGRLFLLARPFQVNPPYQFLNVAGGVAPIRSLACGDETLQVDAITVRARPQPSACGAAAFDEGPIRPWLERGAVPSSSAVDDSVELATGVVAWDVDLAPGASMQTTVASALTGGETAPLGIEDGSDVFDAVARVAAEGWRRSLDRVRFELPGAAQPLLKTLRSNLAFIEIHRDGPAIQPGSRAYARSWIRDGALTGAALLRLRHADTAAAFADWFAGYQYPDGKVPCCVDRRGADPVPENDSHGELVHLIAEVWRYTRDRAFAERNFSHVERAVGAIEALRQKRRTDEYRSGAKLAFFGLLPESISHEGYSARPVHSYWDDTFAYRGLDDAVVLASALGRAELATAWAKRRDELRADLIASIARVRELHHLDTLPASADLADFDSTSTTTMLEPGGLLPYLSRDAVEATFERYWRELVARRDGGKDWEAYTPYELRHVGAFVRLAASARGPGAPDAPDWKGRAHELLAYMLRDRRPGGWNGWPEAVHRDYRKPTFLGDLPHGWVGSDFIRSFLDLFAFESRGAFERGDTLVLGAGIPASWLASGRVSIHDLATPYGLLGYSLEQRRGGFRFTIDGGLDVPPGGIVLVPPSAAPDQGATVDGRPVALAADGTLVIRRVPAVVDFLLATAGNQELHDGR